MQHDIFSVICTCPALLRAESTSAKSTAGQVWRQALLGTAAHQTTTWGDQVCPLAADEQSGDCV